MLDGLYEFSFLNSSFKFFKGHNKYLGEHSGTGIKKLISILNDKRRATILLLNKLGWINQVYHFSAWPQLIRQLGNKNHGYRYEKYSSLFMQTLIPSFSLMISCMKWYEMGMKWPQNNKWTMWFQKLPINFVVFI